MGADMISLTTQTTAKKAMKKTSQRGAVVLGNL